MATISNPYLKKYGFESTPRIVVEVTDHDFNAFRYEQRDCLYRAELGDIASFFSYCAPGSGFGGHHYHITMLDGSKRTLIGPWSSRPGAINLLFPDREPLVDCVSTRSMCTYVRKDVLERLGIKLALRPNYDEPVWEPVP